MLFTIQTYLEEYFNNRNLRISDTYAVDLARIYYYERSKLDEDHLLNKFRSIRTVFFDNNNIDQRSKFEKTILKRLDKKYKKKLLNLEDLFPDEVEEGKNHFRDTEVIEITDLLAEFKKGIEARAIKIFWNSRKKRKLKRGPETIARGVFSFFVHQVLENKGIVVTEFESGIGFVDVGIGLKDTLHLVELKILQNELTGVNQLEQYMINERKEEGHLLLFDARPPEYKYDLPEVIETPTGNILITVVDINPPAPSSLN